MKAKQTKVMRHFMNPYNRGRQKNGLIAVADPKAPNGRRIITKLWPAVIADRCRRQRKRAEKYKTALLLMRQDAEVSRTIRRKKRLVKAELRRRQEAGEA